MNGTLLDLHFDNYFWQEYPPTRYAEIRNLDPLQAKQNHINAESIQLRWFSV